MCALPVQDRQRNPQAMLCRLPAPNRPGTPSKAQVKAANRIAKKGGSPDGPVLDWTNVADPGAALACVEVEDVWGIARRQCC